MAAQLTSDAEQSLTTPRGIVIRSEGQRMLLAVQGTLTAIARDCGAKGPQMVHAWRTGAKLPSAPSRAQIEEAFGIPRRAWCVVPGGMTAPPIGSPDPRVHESVTAGVLSVAHPSTLEDCLQLLSVIRRDRMQVGLMPSERVKLADSEARILALRAKLEESAQYAESRYVTGHPAWIRLRKAIVAALEPHPIAAQAVLAAIESVERTAAERVP